MQLPQTSQIKANLSSGYPVGIVNVKCQTLECERRHLPPVTLVVHGIGDLDETSNVGSSDQRWELALGGWDKLLGSGDTVLKGGLHDVLKTVINLLRDRKSVV